jgi:hypothetical protein
MSMAILLLVSLGCSTEQAVDDNGVTINDNHNISISFGTAMQRSVEFFDQHVKGTNGGS